MARTRRPAPDDIGAQLDILKADIAALSNAVKTRAVNEAEGARSTFSDGIGDLQDQISTLLGNLTETGSGLAEDARERTHAAVDAVGTTIQKNPGMAVLAALGVGFVVGALSRGAR